MGKTHVGSSGESGDASVDGLSTSTLDLGVDTDKLVVLRKTCEGTLASEEEDEKREREERTLRTARGTGLDLSDTEGDDEVGDGGVLGLSRTVGDHDPPSIGLGELGSGDRLGDGADLVDLEEEGVAGLLLDGGLNTEGVGDFRGRDKDASETDEGTWGRRSAYR